MYRKIIDMVSEEKLSVQLPKEYLNKQVEVIAFELNNHVEKTSDSDFTNAIAFFDSLNVNMNNFKFNRDEANQR